MSHFAKVENGLAVQVIVAEQDFIDSGAVGDPAAWIKTSYNTHSGVHYDTHTREPDGGEPLRKNFACLGYAYDAQRDAFIPPTPFASWVLTENSCQWEPPTQKPTDGKRYAWNESTQAWDADPETSGA